MNARLLSLVTARDAMRSVGGILFTLAGVVLLERKSGSYGDGGRLLVLLIPTVLLYGLVIVGRIEAAGRGLVDAEPWQSVLGVLALLLTPVVLIYFFGWVGASTHSALIIALEFALSAALGVLTVWLGRVRYAALLSTLYLLVTWLAVWSKILSHPISGTTIRWLLFAFAAVFALIAVGLTARKVRAASELVTGAGLAAVACGALGIAGLLVGAVGVGRLAGRAIGAIGIATAQQHLIWDLFLLAISVVMIWYGSRARVRGPGYVGALGLILFVYSVGRQLAAALGALQGNGPGPSHSFVGWPLALAVAGLALLVAGVLTSLIGRGAAADEPPPPSAPPGSGAATIVGPPPGTG